MVVIGVAGFADGVVDQVALDINEGVLGVARGVVVELLLDGVQRVLEVMGGVTQALTKAAAAVIVRIVRILAI